MNADKMRLLLLNRRRSLSLLGMAGGAAVWHCAQGDPVQAASPFLCVTAPAQTEGPYFVEERLNRADIRVDPTDGSIRPGALLSLAITVHQVSGAGCAVFPGAHVEVWHCDAGGTYSDVAANNSSGRRFLRGYQIADENGVVRFTTVYPGWYPGRAVHIHFKVRSYSGSTVYDEFTSQVFFDDDLTDQVFAQAPYSQRGRRDTRNTNDGIYTGTPNKERLLLAVTKTSEGYAAAIDIGVNLKTAPAARPAIRANGVVSAASYLPGTAPGAWTTIYGDNLASATRALAASDLPDGSLPTSLAGVSAQVNGKAAFIGFVSPGQLNVLTPADTASGPVPVTVTNAGGASQSAIVNLQSFAPAWFVAGAYVAAVRADGVVIAGNAAAKPGDALALYGTGFGTTTPEIAPGQRVPKPAPLASRVTVMIGGIAAEVLFAGLSGPGLVQINVIVPALPAGEHGVTASIAGLTTQAGVLLRVQAV